MMTLKHSRLILLTAIVAGAAVSTAIAQESLRLLFEITVDGSVVARPEIKVEQGGEVVSKVVMVLGAKPAQIEVRFTPTVRNDNIDIAFDITDGDKRLGPTLRIRKNADGSIEWMSPAHRQKPVRLAVSSVGLAAQDPRSGFVTDTITAESRRQPVREISR